MGKHVAKVFGPGEIVHLDGQQYVDCEFKQTKLIFEGGQIPKFSGCHFDRVNWHLEGAADRTLLFLKFLYATGNKNLIDTLIRVLRGEA